MYTLQQILTLSDNAIRPIDGISVFVVLDEDGFYTGDNKAYFGATNQYIPANHKLFATNSIWLASRQAFQEQSRLIHQRDYISDYDSALWAIEYIASTIQWEIECNQSSN